MKKLWVCQCKYFRNVTILVFLIALNNPYPRFMVEIEGQKSNITDNDWIHFINWLSYRSIWWASSVYFLVVVVPGAVKEHYPRTCRPHRPGPFHEWSWNRVCNLNKNRFVRIISIKSYLKKIFNLQKSYSPTSGQHIL